MGAVCVVFARALNKIEALTIDYLVHVVHFLQTLVRYFTVSFLENLVYFGLQFLLHVRMLGQFVQNKTD